MSFWTKAQNGSQPLEGEAGKHMTQTFVSFPFRTEVAPFTIEVNVNKRGWCFGSEAAGDPSASLPLMDMEQEAVAATPRGEAFRAGQREDAHCQ